MLHAGRCLPGPAARRAAHHTPPLQVQYTLLPGSRYAVVGAQLQHTWLPLPDDGSAAPALLLAVVFESAEVGISRRHRRARRPAPRCPHDVCWERWLGPAARFDQATGLELEAQDGTAALLGCAAAALLLWVAAWWR